MLKFKLYKISADGGKTFTEQWLTTQEADEQKERFCHIVERARIMWDTEKAMDDIIKRSERIKQTQNPSNARDFLWEIKREIEKLLEV